MCKARCCLSAGWAISAVLLFAAADWPQFRGPGSRAVAPDHGLPVTWNAEENIVWKIPLPGFGTSSPITFGDRIYLTCYSGYGTDAARPGDQERLQRHVLCLDRANGDSIWQSPASSQLPEQAYQGHQADHGYASSTPVTDGERLYVFFGRSGVFAFDLDGNQLWQRDVGSGTHGWGSATSPVLFEDLVIVNASVESQSLIALSKETGEEVWRADGLRRTWSSPVLVGLPDGGHEVVVSMEGNLLAFDPRTGKELWSCDGVEDYVCPTVVAEEGIVYAIGGRRGTALAVRAGGRGDVTETHRLWQQDVGSNVPSPVLFAGHLYWVDHRGLAVCLRADTGETVYRERLPGAGGVYASPVIADGNLYAVTRERGTFVLAAEPQFELLAHNDLSPDTSIFNASPAVDDGQLLIRSDQMLYCIGKKP